MQTVSLDELMTVRDAAVHSGVPRSTVYYFIRTGKVIPVRVGGVLFITRADVARMGLLKAS